MVGIETTILALLGLLNLAAIGFLAHWIRMHLDSAMMDIDSKLAIAIKTLIDKLMSGEMSEFEAPNAIHAAFADLIRSVAHNKMQTINATITERDAGGQFVPPESFS